MPSAPVIPVPDFSKVRFVYFDLDDTLIDHVKAQNRALEVVWGRFPQLQQTGPLMLAEAYAKSNNLLWDAYRKNEVSQSELRRMRFEQTLQRLGIKGLDWREMEQAYLECYQRHWDWISDAREVFITLSNKYPVGIMTNGFTFIQKRKFEYFSLQRYTRHLIISEEAGYLKPDPRIFEYSAQQAGYGPSQLLYVGDSWSSDILGAAGSGWKSAWFTTAVSLPDPCAADFVFSRFRELLDVL